MAQVKIIYSLKHLNRYIKNLNNIKIPMEESSYYAHDEILKNWSQGKGANGVRMKKLSENYKDRKIKSGRHGIRDLLYSGDLYRSFIVKKIKDTLFALTFTKDAMGKANANYKRDKKMLTLKKDLKTKVKEIIRKFLNKGAV